jgi:hypothetical protein
MFSCRSNFAMACPKPPRPLPAEPPPLPAGFPGGYVRIIGTVGDGGRVTLQRPPAAPRP